MTQPMSTWGTFAAAEPALAAFVAERLLSAPSYLATVRAGGAPRVHPVTPIFTADGLFVFMEPTSPKAADLRERGWFALHNGVPDNAGTGGEASVSGIGHPVDDDAVRATAVAAAAYDPADRYVLFELTPTDVRCNGYGDVELPERKRWRADTRGAVVDTGSVVILNGASSAGKSSVATALQARWEERGECWVIFGWDDFIPRLPSRWHGVPGAVGDRSDEGISYRVIGDAGERPRALLVPGAVGRRMLRAYHHAVAAIAKSGVNVLVEDVMISADERADWETALADVNALWVAVDCEPDTAAQREQARDDRYPGLARGTSELVHRYVSYDVEVDTTSASAETVAATIDAALGTEAPPS